MPWLASAKPLPACSMGIPVRCSFTPGSGGMSPCWIPPSAGSWAGNGWCCLPPICAPQAWRCRVGWRLLPMRLPLASGRAMPISGSTPSAGSPTGWRNSGPWCPMEGFGFRWHRSWSVWCFRARERPCSNGSGGWRRPRRCGGWCRPTTRLRWDVRQSCSKPWPMAWNSAPGHRIKAAGPTSPALTSAW